MFPRAVRIGHIQGIEIGEDPSRLVIAFLFGWSFYAQFQTQLSNLARHTKPVSRRGVRGGVLRVRPPSDAWHRSDDEHPSGMSTWRSGFLDLFCVDMVILHDLNGTAKR